MKLALQNTNGENESKQLMESNGEAENNASFVEALVVGLENIKKLSLWVEWRNVTPHYI